MLDNHARLQHDMCQQMRAESCLDHAVPLPLYVPTARPEHGETVSEYYRRKHSRGGPGAGRFYPLHQVALPVNPNKVYQ